MSWNTSLKGGVSGIRLISILLQVQECPIQILMKKFSNDLVSSMSKDPEHSSDEELHIPDGITTMALT
jgi:hypothetical protein